MGAQYVMNRMDHRMMDGWMDRETLGIPWSFSSSYFLSPGPKYKYPVIKDAFLVFLALVLVESPILTRG